MCKGARFLRRVRGTVSTRFVAGAALGTLLATSCLQHSDLVECPHADRDHMCWESSRSDAQGRLRHVVIEYVEPGTPCDHVRVEQDSFDERGVLVERAIDQRRCDVIERRVIDRYDFAAGEIEREVSLDLDHDDQFDRVTVQRLPLTHSQRRIAEHREAVVAAELNAARRKDGRR